MTTLTEARSRLRAALTTLERVPLPADLRPRRIELEKQLRAALAALTDLHGDCVRRWTDDVLTRSAAPK